MPTSRPTSTPSPPTSPAATRPTVSSPSPRVSRPDDAACLNDELDDDTLFDIIAEALVGEEPSDDLEAEFQRLDEACQLS
jgi:hypothetical protein